MKIRFFLITTIFALMLSCKKDGNGGLSIKIKSISSNIIPINASLQVIFDFTDNGGHPIDSIYMSKVRINQNQTPTLNDSFGLSAPSYNGTTKGQLQLDLNYSGFLTSAQSPPIIDSTHNESDSVIIKFVAIDNANNKS